MPIDDGINYFQPCNYITATTIIAAPSVLILLIVVMSSPASLASESWLLARMCPHIAEIQSSLSLTAVLYSYIEDIHVPTHPTYSCVSSTPLTLHVTVATPCFASTRDAGFRPSTLQFPEGVIAQ